MLRRLVPVLFALTACLSRYAPPRLDPKTPLTLEVKGPQQRVEVVLDARGIPHVFAQSDADLAFGLGFMHGRDRTFQLTLMTHAARGRLTELFGADVLPVDQQLRVISWRLAEGFAGLTDADRALLETYAKGVNAGAQHAGPPAELALLGLPFGPFTAEDSFAIMRLQAWSLSGDFKDELSRHELLSGLSPTDPRRALFTAPLPSGGVPIVAPNAAPSASAEGVEAHPASASTFGPALELNGLAAKLAQRVGLTSLGASNSWAVHGARTASGHPVLCNDPHLNHDFPSVFYLAHLEHPDFTGVGASFAGIPALLIGHTRRLAWGMTVSYADTQDLLKLEPAPGAADQYLLDGVAVPFERLEQRFVIGHGDQAKVVTETWLSTPFGPVLPEALSRTKDRFVLQWPGFEPGGLNARPVSGFWNLLKADTAEKVTDAVSHLQISGQNMALAFTDGTIAYRLAAYAPQRPEGATGRVPRDGSTSAARNGPLLEQREKPALTNPSPGFLVAANQRVIADEDPRTRWVGATGVPPYRARRIHQRLAEVLANGKPTAEALLSIQQDITSLEGKELAPLLAAACPGATPRHDAEQVQALCLAVRQFDGVFSADSRSALPFVMLLNALRAEVVKATGVQDAARVKALARSFPVTAAVDAELRAHPDSALFAGSLRTMLVAATDAALDELVARAGKRPADWRWGALHTLQFKGTFARAPVVGGFFTSDVFEQSGHGNAIRAESGLPVDHGSALRMVVELSTPPQARFTLDTGQSGALKEPHALDQYPAWASGTPTAVPMTRQAVDAEREGTLVLTPAP